MTEDDIKTPFTVEEVQRLNEWQTNTAIGLSSHPFTCGNRGDGKHGNEGGDTGILIATEGGWVCPHCDYTQDWAHAIMVERQPKLVAILGAHGLMLASGARKALESCLPGYQALAAKGGRGAGVMVECLLNRQKELEVEATRPVEPLESWTIYERPTDYPEGFIARKWLIVAGISDPQPTSEVLADATLDALRSRLPKGLVMVPRSSGDDAKIVETWL